MSDNFWDKLEERLAEEERESIRRSEREVERKAEEARKALEEAEKEVVRLFGDKDKESNKNV